MRELLTADVIASEIMMQRAVDRDITVLIVEGDCDKNVFANFINANCCDIVIGHDKDMVIDILGKVEHFGAKGVLAVVDADYWIVEGHTPLSKNLLCTDNHDMEIMIIRSDALIKVLREHGSEEKIKNYCDTKKCDIRSAMLDLCIPLGGLRLVSHRKSYNLKFKDIKYKEFICHHDLTIHQEKLVKHVKNHSVNHQLDENELLEDIAYVIGENHEPWNLCAGHDMTAALSIALLKKWGSNNDSAVKQEIIERSLRLAFDYSMFMASQLYKSIKEWENDNFPFRILQ